MSELKIFTIGFTKKTAEHFFELLKSAGVQRIVDVRLKNNSQLAGFAKAKTDDDRDLSYLLEKTVGINHYIHLPQQLAPTKDILDAYKKHKGDWKVYETAFNRLMESREIESTLVKEIKDGDCLLCSEHEPEHCHRRLVAEYLQKKWQHVTIEHLVDWHSSCNISPSANG